MISFLDRVKDTVTGFEGVVTAVHDPGTAKYQYGLQPVAKPDGVLPDIVTFDSDHLVVTDKLGDSNRLPFAKALFKYRDQVKCVITGYKGHVVSRTEFLNGCVQYRVQGPLNKDGSIPSTERFAEAGLILLEAADQLPAAKSGGPIKRGVL